MEMALDSADTEELQIEEDAEELRAAEIVRQFKTEMGVSDASGTASASTGGESERLDLPDEDELTSGDRSKTIGKQRTQSD
jgi:phage shock protein A